jgi:hypothetical protein
MLAIMKRTMNVAWKKRGTMLRLISLFHLVAGWSTVAAKPANDACGGAKVVSALPFALQDSTSESTADFAVATCGISETGAGIWYTYTPAATKIVSVNVAWNSGPASTLRVFSGSCDDLVCLAASGPWSSYASNYEWIAEAGVQYHILVSPPDDSVLEPLTYNIAIDDIEVPSNDECALATPIESLPYTTSGTSAGALTDFDEPTCGASEATNGVWYAYTPEETKIVRVTVAWTDGLSSTVLRVFSGACESLSCVIMSGPTSSYDSGHTWIAEGGVTYMFLVSGASFNTGLSFEFSVEDFEVPSNASCDAAIQVTLPYEASTSTAGALPYFETDICGVSPDANGIWYTHTPTETKMLHLEFVWTDGGATVLRGLR